MCESCKDKEFEVHPYVIQLWRTAMLLESGFPATPDTFDMDYWMDLGIMRLKIRQAFFRPLIG
jgi:hypothetical protein